MTKTNFLIYNWRWWRWWCQQRRSTIKSSNMELIQTIRENNDDSTRTINQIQKNSGIKMPKKIFHKLFHQTYYSQIGPSSCWCCSKRSCSTFCSPNSFSLPSSSFFPILMVSLLMQIAMFCPTIETSTSFAMNVSHNIQQSQQQHPYLFDSTSSPSSSSSSSNYLASSVSKLQHPLPYSSFSSLSGNNSKFLHNHHHSHHHHNNSDNLLPHLSDSHPHHQHHHSYKNPSSGSQHHTHHLTKIHQYHHHSPNIFNSDDEEDVNDESSLDTVNQKDSVDLDLRPYQPHRYQSYLHQSLADPSSDYSYSSSSSSSYSSPPNPYSTHHYHHQPPQSQLLNQIPSSSSSASSSSSVSQQEADYQLQLQLEQQQLQILPIENVTVSVGRNAILKCIINRPGHFNVAWLKMDANLGPTLLTLGVNSLVTEEEGKYKVTHNERQWLLHVNRVQVQDRGRYMCQMNSKSMTSPSISTGYLDVHEPPVIIEELTSSDTTVDELQKVSLRCATAGYPSPSVSWRRENGKSLNLGLYGGKKFAAHKWDGEYLNITQVTREDMGAYLCIASNGVPPSVSKRIVIQVNFRPKIRVHNQLVSAYLGSDVELECRVESSPRPQTVWLTSTGQKLEELTDLSLDDDSYGRHSSEQQPYNSPGAMDHNTYIRTNINGQSKLLQNHFHSKRKKFQIDEDNDGYRTIMRLTIRRLDANDFGPYKCVAKNSLGEKEGLVRLYEIPVPTLPPTTSTTTTTTTRRPTPPPSPPPMPNIIQTSAIGSGMMVNGQWKTKSNNGGVQINYSKESNDALNSGRSLRENQKKIGKSNYNDDDDVLDQEGNDDDITYIEQLYEDKIKSRKTSSSASLVISPLYSCRNSHSIYHLFSIFLAQILYIVVFIL